MSVHLAWNGKLAFITLDRPEVLNALSFAIIEELGKALDAVAQSDARALIVSGAGGKAFCAGADIGELTGRGLVAQWDGARLGQTVFARLDDLAIPSFAVIDGYAFGGGAELAMACTFRIGTPRTRIALPEVKLGLIPGYGGTQRLPRLVGHARALELILTGRTVKPDEALAWGLINRLVDGDPLAAAVAFADEVIGHGAVAVRLAMRAVECAATHSLHDGLKAEAELSTLACRTADAEEGMTAFLEKRQPRFEGR